MIKDRQELVKSLLLPVSLSAMVLLSGCGGTFGDKETDEAKKYEVAQALDSGDYDKAIAMLEKDCAGYSTNECRINLGSAYLGKAGMDIISLGKDLTIIDGNQSATQLQKDTQTMTVLFDIIFDDSVKQGAQVYKQILPDQNSSVCNGTDYQTLNSYQKQACIAINPILLQELMSEDTDQESLSVDIETIAEFKDVLGAVIPDITTADIVSVLDDSPVGDADDINNNDDIDAMEATDCAMNSYSDNPGGGFTDYGCIAGAATVTGTDIGTVAFTDVTETLKGVDVTVQATITGYTVANFTRLVTEQSGVYTNVVTEGYCEVDRTTECGEGDAGCYPCPVLNTDGTVKTLNDTIVTVLNNDDLLTSIALMSDSDETKTSDEKVQEFKDEICYTNYAVEGTVVSTTNLYTCDANGDITQDALLDYMAQ